MTLEETTQADQGEELRAREITLKDELEKIYGRDGKQDQNVRRHSPMSDPIVELLSLQIVYVAKEPILCMISTIQDMGNFVRTAFGDSQTRYGGDIWDLTMKPSPQQLGQGNGADTAR